MRGHLSKERRTQYVLRVQFLFIRMVVTKREAEKSRRREGGCEEKGMDGREE